VNVLATDVNVRVNVAFIARILGHAAVLKSMVNQPNGPKEQ